MKKLFVVLLIAPLAGCATFCPRVQPQAVVQPQHHRLAARSPKRVVVPPVAPVTPEVIPAPVVVAPAPAPKKHIPWFH